MRGSRAHRPAPVRPDPWPPPAQRHAWPARRPARPSPSPHRRPRRYRRAPTVAAPAPPAPRIRRVPAKTRRNAGGYAPPAPESTRLSDAIRRPRSDQAIPEATPRKADLPHHAPPRRPPVPRARAGAESRGQPRTESATCQALVRAGPAPCASGERPRSGWPAPCHARLHAGQSGARWPATSAVHSDSRPAITGPFPRMPADKRHRRWSHHRRRRPGAAAAAPLPNAMATRAGHRLRATRYQTVPVSPAFQISLRSSDSVLC